MQRPDPPRLPVIPLFEELLTIPQLCRSRAACVVYGVIAAYHAQGYQPTIADVAVATWRTSSARNNPTRRAVLLLERVGMLRRVRKAQNDVRFELLGPVMHVEPSDYWKRRPVEWPSMKEPPPR